MDIERVESVHLQLDRWRVYISAMKAAVDALCVLSVFTRLKILPQAQTQAQKTDVDFKMFNVEHTVIRFSPSCVQVQLWELKEGGDASGRSFHVKKTQHLKNIRREGFKRQ